MPDRALVEQIDQAIEAVLAGAAPAAAIDPALLEIVHSLRSLPDQGFKTRLRNSLEGRTSMSTLATASTVAPIREGFHTVTPYVTVPEGDALIEFLKKTFDAEELLRHSSPTGFQAEVRIGDSILMIGSGESVRGREKLAALHIYVPDCDATFQRALDAGATSMGEPADRPYGERAGFVKDVSGNHWYIATHLGATPALESVWTVTPFVHPTKAASHIDFLTRAFGAVELARYEDARRVVYAAVRIGDAVVEMGEAHDEVQRLPSGFYLYVEDVDAVYQQALAAGATSIWPPTDQTYGDRNAGLQDPFGYQWFPATQIG